MLFCKLKNEDKELLNICIAQRYCNQKQKYIANNQERNCKYYE